MQHQKPRQRADNGKWDWSTEWNRFIFPAGYCSGYHEPDPDKVYMPQGLLDRMRRVKHKYHDDGHDTPEEAVACYKEYLLDHYFRVWDDPDTKHKCEVCGEWTNHRASVQHRTHALCDKHATREAMLERMDFNELWE